jgi:integrase
MSSKRGQGSVYRPTYTDKRTGKTKVQAVWWISYSIGGKKYRESSGSRKQGDAVKILHQRLAERGRGFVRRDLERVKYEDLEALIVADYRKNQRKSAGRLGNSLAHLRARFSGWRVVDIGEDGIDAYAVGRLDEGAAPATVNRELAALRRMFNLGRRARMVFRVPSFSLLAERNVREGFVKDDAFAALEAELPEHLKPLAVAAFSTGWRRGELLSRRWRHVDFENGWLRLEPGESKNDQGRQFPLVPRLRAALKAQHAQKLETERRTGRIVSAVFFYPETGEPVKDFRGAWESACRRAGCPELLFHDFRRTAVRNLVRAAIPEVIAMKLTGHLTPSVFKRYAIVDEGMLKEAGEKLASLHGDAQPERKVLPLER